MRRLECAMIAVFLLVAAGAEAALTTPKCLTKKRLAWSTLRKCQTAADVQRLKGKLLDLAKCQTTFQQKLAKIDQKAAAAGIACRYGDDGATVTDYDTALMWEKKDGTFGGLCIVFPGDHCVNDTSNWAPAQEFVGSTSADGVLVASFLAGYLDWRLPTISELSRIVDLGAPGCDGGSPCIDPIFGATALGSYWSSTTPSGDTGSAWCVSFADGVARECFKGGIFYVRAVRGAF